MEKLTKLQKEMLEHRLGVPCAITECLTSELTANQYNSQCRSAWNLENKIENETGMNVSFPLA